MDMHEIFLERICKEPNSDENRLIYADWLEEQADPRGEFIRASIQQELVDRWSPEYWDLSERAQSLLRKHQLVWDQEATGDVDGASENSLAAV